jgi:tetratricopeptide (TPR) repeat protein
MYDNKFQIKVSIILIMLLSSVTIAGVSPEIKRELDKNLFLVERRPSDPRTHFNLAMSMAYSGLLEEGFDQLAIVNKLDKNFANSKSLQLAKNLPSKKWQDYFHYGFTLYFIDQKDKSIEMFEKVVEIKGDDPVSGWAKGYMAVIYRDKKMLEKSAQLLHEAIKLEPSGAFLYLALGYVHKELGNALKSTRYMLKGASLKARQSLSRK